MKVSTFLMRILLLTIAVAGTAFLAGCDEGSQSSVKGIKSAQVQAELTKTRSNAPGLAGGVISDDAIVIGVDGYLSSTGNAPMRTDNWLHLGSNSKSMTAMAIAVQVEQGRLHWNDRLERLFPELADEMLPDYRRRTLVEVLTFRAGLLPMLQFADFAQVPIIAATLPEQRLEFVRWVLTQQPVNTPGTTEYSNASYVLAGAILERANGKSFEQTMQETLLVPLGLRGVYGLPQTVGADQPAAHTQISPGVFQPVLPDDPLVQQVPRYLNPAGLLAMPLPDYARYAQIHLQALRGRPTLLKAETYKVLHTALGELTGTEFGLAPGWGVRTDAEGNNTYEFLGSIDVMSAFIKIIPRDNRAVIVMNNYDAADKLSSLMDTTSKALLALRPAN